MNRRPTTKGTVRLMTSRRGVRKETWNPTHPTPRPLRRATQASTSEVLVPHLEGERSPLHESNHSSHPITATELDNAFSRVARVWPPAGGCVACKFHHPARLLGVTVREDYNLDVDWLAQLTGWWERRGQRWRWRERGELAIEV